MSAMPHNDMLLQELGAVLRDARDAAGKTHFDVRLAGGLSESNLSRLENGHLNEPPKKLGQVLAAYATVTGIPTAELLNRWGASVRRRELAQGPPE